MKVNPDPAGLRTRHHGDHIALRGVRLRSRLSGMSQRTTLEQTYINLERQAIEAVYTFPLPESAAVCGFEVITGDRVLTGQIEEIEQAVEQYEKAIGEGHGAFMVEENRPDVFTVRVGNLKPRQAVTIRLTYVCPLERADRQIRVAFPTTAAPRYATATATDPLDAMIDGDALNPPHVLSVPYGITMEVQVDLGRRLKAVTSPSHRISVCPGRDINGHDADGRQALVTLAAHGVSEMDRDIVLNIELPREHEPVVEAAPGPDGASYLAVSFVPEFEVDDLAAPEPSETVFVLDCSGSMQGGSIAQATAALELCLRSLSVGDTFNICRFGSTFELMSSEPLHYSQETLDRAVEYVRDSGDLGGTELYAALHAVLSPSPRVGRCRQVILLTDGQVTNEPALLDLARQMRPRNRIFSFGIGTACSTSLVKGLARATGGEAEFIAPGERIDDKVLRTFARLASPMVSDVAVDWGGCDVQTLAELPPVFDGDVLTVFGRAPGKLPRAASLSCRSRTGPVKWDVTVPAPVDDGGVIATMWARRAIQSLEEVNGLQAQRYRPGERSREAQTLVNLSKQFGLLSSLTTFIAIEHRSPQERNDGRPALRRVPVMLAEGWGGIEEECLAALCDSTMASPGASHYVLNKSVDRSIATSAEVASRRAKAGGGAKYSRPPARSLAPDATLKSLDRSTGSGGSGLLDLCRESGSDDPTDAPITKLLEALVAEAFRSGVTEVHLEGLPDRVQVQFRIDDKPVDRDRIPLRMHRPLFKRIMSMAGMTKADLATPQEGQFTLQIDGGYVPVAVKVAPAQSGQGQSAVLHLPPEPAGAALRRLLALQSAEGWFSWDRTSGRPDPIDVGVRRLGLDPAEWWKKARSATRLPAGAPAWDADRVARTGTVLVILRALHAADHHLWRRAEQKASRYLQDAMRCDASAVAEWLKKLEADLAGATKAIP
jgi:Ca-activated chloride channel family protein